MSGVRDRIVAETRGNPLALLELPRGVTPADLAGGFGSPGVPGLPGGPGSSGRIEESFRRRVEVLPAATQRLMLVAAAEPAGDPALVWRAAERLGIGAGALAPAADAGLLTIGERVMFRHPLVRSAVYRAAPGLAAAAAFMERSAALTLDPARRAERALAAAQATYQAGAFEAALGLLGTAEAGPLDELQRAWADRLRGQVAFASSRGSDAPPLLLKAARQFEPLDSRLARETYLDALAAA